MDEWIQLDVDYETMIDRKFLFVGYCVKVRFRLFTLLSNSSLTLHPFCTHSSLYLSPAPTHFSLSNSDLTHFSLKLFTLTTLLPL